MIDYSNLITNLEGIFWFPEDTKTIFKGIIENGMLFLRITNNIFLENAYFLKNTHYVIIQGKSKDNVDITIRGSMSEYSRTNGETFDICFNVFMVLHGKLYTSMTDVKFNAIIINFTNIAKWISSHMITYSDLSVNSSIIKFEIDDDLEIQFFNERPIRPRDKLNIDNFFNVYVKLTSKTGGKSLDEWFKLKNIIQDFINFNITDSPVLVHSIYGIIDDGVENKEIDIQFKSFISKKMNKCDNTKSVLIKFKKHESQIQKMLKNWFEFSKNKVIYSFYFNYMYEPTSFELRVFKLASFLEAFHDEYVFEESRSDIYKEKVNRKKNIFDKIPIMDLTSKDEEYLRNKIGDTSLSLKERFTELFDPFWKLIAVQNPLLSFVCIDDPKKIKLDLTSETKEELVRILDEKKLIDMNHSDVKRQDLYKRLLQNISNDCKLKLSFFYLIRQITIDSFASVASTYRNIIGHSLNKHSKIHPYRWLYMAKTLEFVSQIWILKKIFELENKEIEDIYSLDKYDNIEVIICSNIQEYDHHSLSHKT